MDRRSFFRFGLRKAAKTLADTVRGVGESVADFAQERRDSGRARRGAAVAPRVELRPPGAVSAELFLDLCIKCSDCIEACPTWAIDKAADGSGYPVLDPNTRACGLCEDPLPCVQSCETGALEMLPRGAVRLGLAMLEPRRCVVPRGQSCDSCVLYCPVAEEAIRMSEDGPVIIESGCTGCGICAVICPEKAIRIEALP